MKSAAPIPEIETRHNGNLNLSGTLHQRFPAETTWGPAVEPQELTLHNVENETWQ